MIKLSKKFLKREVDIMRLKQKIGVILILCSLFVIYSGYKRYEYYSSLPEVSELHSITIKGPYSRPYIDLNDEEINAAVHMLKDLKYGGWDGSTRYGVIDPEYISFNIRSRDCSVTPHFFLNLYVEEGVIKGVADVKSNNFEVLKCDELYHWAFDKFMEDD